MVCCFAGHSDAPLEIKKKLKSIIENLIVEKNVEVFYVGDKGSFDFLALSILKELSLKYEFEYSVVLAYLPKSKKYDNSIYPEELEKTPYKYRIIKRNQWMVRKSDFLIAYVNRNFGGAKKTLDFAIKQNKIIFNIEEKIAVD